MKLYEFFIGFRYLKSKKNQSFISFNTLISIIMVFLGVFILIVVLSVMNGFQSQIKDKILDVDSHITISSRYGDESGVGIKKYDTILERLKGVKNITSVEPYIQGLAILDINSKILPTYIRAMGTKDHMPADIKKFLTKDGAQSFNQKRGIFIGKEMADYNGISVGDRVSLIVLKGRLRLSAGVEPVKRRFIVIGTFKTGYYEFDSNLIVMSLPEAQSLYSLGAGIKGVSIKVDDVYLNLDSVATELRSIFRFDYNVQTTEEKKVNLFRALKMEKLIMWILLSLIIVGAGFMILGTVFMVVMEKRKAIGILKSMGARPFSITLIFTLEGFIIGFLGTVLGVLFGLGAALNIEEILITIERIVNVINQPIFEFQHPELVYQKITIIPQNIYYIDGLPTEVVPEIVVTIAVIALGISTIAALFPSWIASKAKPVETIRYE